MEPRTSHVSKPFLGLKINTKLKTKNTEHLWEEIRSLGCRPNRRSYHSAAVWRNKMLIYGGQDFREGLQAGFWAYYLSYANEEIWEEIQIPELIPICRHTSIVKGDLMYIFGGTNGVKEFNDTWIINLTYRTVEILTPEFPDLPPPHDSHTAVLYENGGNSVMIVFGGFVKEKRSNKVYSLNLATLKWKLEDTMNGPEPRSNHSAVLYKDSIYIYGGSSSEGEKLDDFWKLSLDTFIWEQIVTRGITPAGRSGHSAIVYRDVMVIFGGMKDVANETNEMYSYGFVSNEWTLFQNDHQVKDPVSAAQLEEYKLAKAPVPARRHTTHVQHCGMREEAKAFLTPKMRSNTEYAIEPIHSPLEGRVKGRAPHQRDGHSAVVYNETMYIFGGDRHQMPFSDLYAYSLIEDELKTPVKLD